MAGDDDSEDKKGGLFKVDERDEDFMSVLSMHFMRKVHLWSFYGAHATCMLRSSSRDNNSF